MKECGDIDIDAFPICLIIDMDQLWDDPDIMFFGITDWKNGGCIRYDSDHRTLVNRRGELDIEASGLEVDSIIHTKMAKSR